MRRAWKTPATSVALLLMVGCSQTPPTHFYVFELQQSAAVRAQSEEGWAIGVRSFVVDAPYDQDRIVYRLGEGSPEVYYYAYHQWAAPLSRMLADSVADGLTGTEGVRSIEPLIPGRPYDAYLEGRVLALEEIDQAAQQIVRLRIDLLLVSRENEELWSRALRLEGTTNTTEVVVIVERMNNMLAQALSEAGPDLAAALAGHSAP